MNSIQQIVIQELNEEQYSKKSIDSKIRYAIESNPVMDIKVLDGIELVKKYLDTDYYDSKMQRISQLVDMDIGNMVLDIFVGIAYFQISELFTSAAAQIASRLNLSDKTEAITTVAELLAVLCQTDAFDITKANKHASLMLISKIPLGEELLTYIEHSQYLPPMVCEPNRLDNNYSSGYLNHNSSRILGTSNNHDGDICLDILDVINKVAFKLDVSFLNNVQEQPTFELDTPEKIAQWTKFKLQSYHFYGLMITQGNKFYFDHSVDKRGRIYPSGYHINYQGTGHKKAMLDLAREELVTGVPCT